MALPFLLGGLGRMGLGIGTATLGGLGMGIGYGYGVRLGYNAYKPSGNARTNKQVLSLNPVEAGNGMGRHTAEQQFNMTTEPSISNEVTKLVKPEATAPSAPQPVDQQTEMIYSRTGKWKMTRAEKNQMGRQEYKDWYNERYWSRFTKASAS